jgi:hypothetical protein
LNEGSTAEKNDELIHTRRRVKVAWKVKLKNEIQKVRTRQTQEPKELRRDNKI